MSDDYDETYGDGPQEPPSEPYPDACQGCSMITGAMTACLDLCVGVRSEADLNERARRYATEHPEEHL